MQPLACTYLIVEGSQLSEGALLPFWVLGRYVYHTVLRPLVLVTLLQHTHRGRGGGGGGGGVCVWGGGGEEGGRVERTKTDQHLS